MARKASRRSRRSRRGRGSRRSRGSRGSRRSRVFLVPKNQIDDVRNKNKPLEKMWKSLADGKSLIFIYKNNTYKIKKTKISHDDNVIELGNNDDNVKAILSAGNSYDGYRDLYSKAGNKTVKEVLKNYKKYFSSPAPFPGTKGLLI